LTDARLRGSDLKLILAKRVIEDRLFAALAGHQVFAVCLKTRFKL